jgi:endogenous inhibitor of DNA gyrase (YacG/DUF329 family)
MKDVEENRGRNCAYCGAIVEQEQGKKPRRFCSKQCRVKWWSLHRDESNHQDPHEIICAACGDVFVVTRSSRGRKYCCKEHYVAAQNGLKIYPNPKNESWVEITEEEMEKGEMEPALESSEILSYEKDEVNRREQFTQQKRAEVLSLYGAGFGASWIAKKVRLPLNTIKSWIYRYQHQDWTGSEELITEWISESVECVPLAEMEEHRIFLVSGPYDFRGKIDGFLAKIPEALAQNLAVGDVFVFCRRSRHQISALQWQGEGFAMIFRRAEGERYPWPVSAQVKVIEISRNDLHTLLEYPRFVKRLSGQATPDNYL